MINSKTISIFSVITLAFGICRANLTAGQCLAIKSGRYSCSLTMVDKIKNQTTKQEESTLVTPIKTDGSTSWDSLQFTNKSVGEEVIGCASGNETSGSEESQNLAQTTALSTPSKMTGVSSFETSGEGSWPRKTEISYSIVSKNDTSFSREESVKTYDKKMKLTADQALTEDCQFVL